ncbi:MAG: AzlD domain-containing protein [Actinocatenispora sp.]
MSRDMLVWIAVLLTALGCFGWKVLGMSVPSGLLDRPLVRRFTALVPVALLAALTAVEVLASPSGRLVLDARLAGLAAAALALLLRAPFLVVVGVAVAVTATLRMLGVG